MKDSITKSEYEVIKEKLYLNITDIKRICGCGYNKASDIVKNVNSILKKEHIYVPTNTKAPTARVLKYLGLENDYEN
jgi:hypothetical protein